MAYIGCGDIRGLINRTLKGENQEHVVYGCSNPVDSLPAPGPDRGRNEVNSLYPFPSQSRFNSEIEVGRIDAKEHIWAHIAHLMDE
jgi:hypothetical protein